MTRRVNYCNHHRLFMCNAILNFYHYQKRHVRLSKMRSPQEEFEDTKVVIRIRKSKKDRQLNGQKKKDEGTNNDLQNIHIKLKHE